MRQLPDALLIVASVKNLFQNERIMTKIERQIVAQLCAAR